MATGRMLKKNISISEQVNDLSLVSALLFTWMIPHTDDFGKMLGAAAKIKGIVFPLRNDISIEQVEKSLNEMQEKGLIFRYQFDGELYIEFPKFDTHQTGLHKRSKSAYPSYSQRNGEDCCYERIPGNSRKFPEIPGNSG